MVYGAEAVLPSDIRHDSPRVAAYLQADNEKTRQDSLDQLDEERDIAAACSAIYQQDLRRYHSHRVKIRTFQEGDLVLRLIQDQTGMHKLSPPWEGPFVVSKNLNNGHTILSMFETTRTHACRRRRQAGCGIFLIFGLITLEPSALVVVHTFTNVYIMINIIKSASLII